MISVIFKDLEKSELAKETTINRIRNVEARFPDLRKCRVMVTLSMQNSPIQAGPDLFTVKFICKSGKYKGVILEKSAPTLYKALADLSDYLLERLNRFSDKTRVKNLRQIRQTKKHIINSEIALAKYGT